MKMIQPCTYKTQIFNCAIVYTNVKPPQGVLCIDARQACRRTYFLAAQGVADLGENIIILLVRPFLPLCLI